MRFLLLPPIVVLMSAGIMFLLHVAVPIVQLVPRPANFAGLILVVAGLGIANWHARLFRRIGSNINTFGEPGRLTTEGLFRRTRNPMYLGMIVFLAGVACMLGSISPMAGPLGFFILANYWYIPLEERAMALKFGNEYFEYQRSVPRWL
ncbi:isoprenylcysteine carboxylmethyltransferase family protein [Methylomonas sp. EFPC3]|uniref:methyltransferase family protein n=1 Tax=Methylomonas sp. EFPC3 TaxID=3021710 RepID=UPI002417DA6B|nr:isoprenylcysteine carboxylmethyltransferase family protein [Methylomonas sp. EFPC3]WFP48717.1 isoprenylcysteine carboxylmethyltransferase family protein [Methylomonas sp. EFPC3]